MKQVKFQIKCFLVFVAILLCVSGMAQNAKVDASGNYSAISHKSQAKPTGKTFTDTKGNIYPVEVSVNGKLFYRRVSKTGNEYSVYIKVN